MLYFRCWQVVVGAPGVDEALNSALPMPMPLPMWSQVAKVMLGEPPQDYKTFIQQVGTVPRVVSWIAVHRKTSGQTGQMKISIDFYQWKMRKAVGFKLIHMRTMHCIVPWWAPCVPCIAGKNQALLKEKKEAAEAELARKKAWCMAELHHAAPMVWECHESVMNFIPKILGPYCRHLSRLWKIHWQFLKRITRRDLGWCQFSATGVINSWVSWWGGSCAEKGARGTEESARDLQKTLTLSERQDVWRILQVYHRSPRQAISIYLRTTAIRLQILPGHYWLVQWVDVGSKLDTPEAPEEGGGSQGHGHAWVSRFFWTSQDNFKKHVNIYNI